MIGSAIQQLTMMDSGGRRRSHSRRRGSAIVAATMEEVSEDIEVEG